MRLRITLESDTTFGGADGVPGLVDLEVRRDRYGLPLVPWRRIKGLLTEECANLLYALKTLQSHSASADLEAAASALFGSPGGQEGALRGGDARLPEDLEAAIIAEVRNKRVTPDEVIGSLTAIRRQSAIDPRGAPAEGSLRAMRVLLRECVLEARVMIDPAPDETQQALLGGCIRALRRGGVGRNRGLGRLSVQLLDEKENKDLATEWLSVLERLTEATQP